MTRLLALLALIAAAGSAMAAGFDYHLAPRQIAPGTWVLEGKQEDFTFANGGRIVNTAFVVTEAGVVVIDSGPSRQYGEQTVAAIARLTGQPIVKVWITHHHPDHFLGNQAFPPATLSALAQTTTSIETEGKAFNENMYRLVGDAMRDTEVVLPTQSVAPGTVDIGGHRFELLALDGHTAGDLAVFDHRTGVLFAGDLVFHDRTPTTPHATIARWLKSLDTLDALPFKQVVPGHGPVAADNGPIRQTRDYLHWLDGVLKQSAAAGLDMTEVMHLPLPKIFRQLAVIDTEYPRSVSHLYPAVEEAALKPSAH
ncbi:quinoprotein relay system zinc metallohydrolase 1 [Denitromonas iodatirespirans]|uniref:Quinoprotein relay system zinc metallohydrolase 1 n=1 Tax=Denitromonas iodatirespirans TaxID=2795389 RepID=A0A944D7L1_DENI1|nr:quinoprotein relay system zinc metallohydrolase 1 [Denitromonas iodatirespirans]MBT0961530.1 quinoprotein relay system zinc metallohydrolase 1 [Denitromonas iodatirespirans]